jgi:hypothetical protein
VRGRSTLALVVGLSVLTGTRCLAVTVEPVSGDLSINRPGQGFQKVSEPTEVNPGDLLMVSANGSANVFYPDGCRFVLQPGSVLTVAAISPCAANSNAQAPPQDTPPAGSPFGDPVVWGAGAAVLGLAGFVGYEVSHAGKTTTPRPASP